MGDKKYKYTVLLSERRRAKLNAVSSDYGSMSSDIIRQLIDLAYDGEVELMPFAEIRAKGVERYMHLEDK